MFTFGAILLEQSDLDQALMELPGWTLEAGKLHREYAFSDFVAAFGFMTGTALIAQGICHHPEWSNHFNTVRIDLVTNDSGGITWLDLRMAQAMEELAARWLPDESPAESPGRSNGFIKRDFFQDRRGSLLPAGSDASAATPQG